MDMMYFYLGVGGICILFVIITSLLGIYVKSKGWVKYLPALLSFLSSAGLIIKARELSEGFAGLGYVVLGLVCGLFFLASLITAFVIDAVRLINRKKTE